MGWFFDDARQLVCHLKNDAEQRYTIFEMRRFPRKYIKGVRTDWWGFNNSQLLLKEPFFQWQNVGLHQTLAKKSTICKDKPDEAKSNV